ncbi:hypothetical protein [Mobilicoccus caccae]|uniref:STAS domain-containing protein n=1 Tax=Mobilicoccus caccae TaxID=1859295 RepID=A0ABQ6ISF0_9MICO|nr:hypothetical protein [Mobilicoccus caccae]GMA40198.1 hypothetical protein GCM10025883_22430 [Mobilicoccus caccae]
MTTQESRPLPSKAAIPNNHSHRTRVGGELTLDVRGAASHEIVSRLHEVQRIPAGTVVELDVDGASEWTPCVGDAVRAAGRRANFVVTSADGLALSRWHAALTETMECDR